LARTVHAGRAWLAAFDITAGAAEPLVGAAERAEVRKRDLRVATRARAAFALASGAVDVLVRKEAVTDAVAPAERVAKEIRLTRAKTGLALAGGAVEGLVRWALSDAVAPAEGDGGVRAYALAGGVVEILPLRTDVGHAHTPAERGATRAAALAHPAHAFAPFGAAVTAAAAVPLVRPEVDAPLSATGLG
jgi:hypothetical protein